LGQAVDHEVIAPLLAAVPQPQGRQAGKGGRDALSRKPMVKAYLISRYPGSGLPHKLLTLYARLAEHPDVARLFGFDGHLPDRSTLHPVFKALDNRPDLVGAAFSAISDRLLRTPQAPEIITAPPPKPRRSGKRDGNGYREARRKAALGLIPLLHRKLRCEDEAVEFAKESRWPDGVRCPSCDSTKVRRESATGWRCRACGSRFSLTSNTFLHSSNVAMLPTLLAMYLTIQSPTGVDALFLSDCLQDDLGRRMDHSEALYLQHRIRAATYETPPKFAGPIQVDDTYIGTENGIKMQIIGGVDQSTNRLWAEIVDGEVTQGIVNPFVYHLREDGAWVYSDQGGAYAGIPWPHLTVNHSLPVYGRFDENFRRYVTTNWIESFWAFIDRLILEHGRVSRKHLPLYLSEAL
jgi:ribosomal protein L37AE/L43A